MQRIVLTAAACFSPEHDTKLILNGWKDTIKKNKRFKDRQP
jgi:hypothetical protein